MAFLTPDKVRTEHGLIIKEKIIPWGAKWPKDSGKYKKGDQFKADRLLSGGTGKVAWVTIHNTEDIREVKGTNDAEQYTRATWPNANMNDSRVHYFIDETDCWQNLREDEVGWHAGDNGGKGNDSSLAIEIIMDGSGSSADKSAEDRGALLAAILLNRHGLGIQHLTTHQRWSGKNCPVFILPHWDEFKDKVNKYLAQIKNNTVVTAPSEEKKPEAQKEYKYYVQVGVYTSFLNASNMVSRLKAAGFDAFIKTEEQIKEEIVAEKEEPKVETQKEVILKEGDMVRMQKDAPVYGKDYTFKDWVYKSVLFVRDIAGDRIVVSTVTTGPITGVVDKKYLTKV